MTVSFILGRAGAGKTRRCLDEIREELQKDAGGAPLIFLVPEQATFQLERELINSPGLEAVSRAQVMSFRRLAWHVFQETGGLVRPHISDTGKRMLIRSILSQRASQLRILPQTANKMDISHKLASNITELKLYNVQPGDLLEQAAHLEREKETRQLADKLHDLAIIYQDLEDCLAGRYTDPDDYLKLLGEKLRFSRKVVGAKIWVDGFSGFTPQEYRVLGNLMAVADEIKIALCMPAEAADKKLSEVDVFYITWETYQKLVQLAQEKGVPVDKVIDLDKPHLPRFKDEYLGHLEREYPEWPGLPKEGKPESITLVSAANRRAEVEAVARKMVQLAREKGYRWREMSVMCRSLEPYIDLLRTVFKEFGIPVFIDQKQGVAHHPMVELVRSGLEIISSNWSYDPVFRYLKTDLVPIGRHEVDWLENYCLANGIKGYSWTSDGDWYYVEELDFDTADRKSTERRSRKADQLRRQVVATLEPLMPFTGYGKYPVAYISRAVWELLKKLQVKNKLQKWQQQEEQAGNLIKAQEHSQVWDRVIELLDQMVEVLGEEEVTVKEYLEILEAGLEELCIGLIPPGLDQALVGGIERSRNPDIKALFFLGVTEGIFPLYKAEDQYFSDEEREWLAEQGLELAPTSRQRLFQEQYLIYISLTRPSEYLWLSYPLADAEGKALRPSSVISRVRQLLPDLETEYVALNPENPEQVRQFLTPGTKALGLLINELRAVQEGKQLDPVWQQVLRYYAGEEKYRPVLRHLLKAFDFSITEENLPADLVSQLYPNPVKTSVSQLEQYARCPFSHFSRYILKLRERREFSLDALNLGKIYHRVLAEFVHHLQRQGLDWGQLRAEQQRQLVDRVIAGIEEVLQQSSVLQQARARYQLQLVRETLLHSVAILTEHANRGDFSPLLVETAFDEGAPLKPLKITLANNWSLVISGRIDRVDTLSAGGTTYLRVIDYKSSDTDISWWRVYHGLQLQLFTYLWACINSAAKVLGEEADAAGAFYFPVIRPLVDNAGPMDEQEIEAKLKKKNRMQGVLLWDTEVARCLGVDVRGDYSDLLPVYVKQDGNFGRDTKNILNRERMQALLEFTQNKIKELGENLVAGNIDVKPYRVQKKSPCSYCEYKPVCQFDVNLAGGNYRFLQPADNDTAWRSIFQAGERGDG